MFSPRIRFGILAALNVVVFTATTVCLMTHPGQLIGLGFGSVERSAGIMLVAVALAVISGADLVLIVRYLLQHRHNHFWLKVLLVLIGFGLFLGVFLPVLAVYIWPAIKDLGSSTGLVASP